MKKIKCPKCKKIKTTTCFYKSKRTKSGLYCWCKECCSIHNKKNYKKDKEKVIARLLKSRYGLTFEQYNKILKRQNYECAICGKTEKENKRRLAVDHSHKTNFIRGLLCVYCNNKLMGCLCDDRNYTIGLITYLQNAINNDTDWV